MITNENIKEQSRSLLNGLLSFHTASLIHTFYHRTCMLFILLSPSQLHLHLTLLKPSSDVIIPMLRKCQSLPSLQTKIQFYSPSWRLPQSGQPPHPHTCDSSRYSLATQILNGTCTPTLKWFAWFILSSTDNENKYRSL